MLELMAADCPHRFSQIVQPILFAADT